MRMRSTGLGKTELVGKINDITPAGDYLILHVGTIEPVRWHVRAALNFSEMLKVLLLILKPPNLLFMLTHIFRPKPKPDAAPPDF